jgi:hypothetical protein
MAHRKDKALDSVPQGCHEDVFGRTDDWTMAAGASVTWTHCSVLFEVTWDKTRCVRANMGVRADAKKNNNNNFFLVVVAGVERENSFSIFNFQFSIPKIPKLPKLSKLPELRGLRGRSREKKKVFSA